MVSQNNPGKKAEKEMAAEEKPKKIMVQPLPQILDEIDNSINLADEAAKNAREAAEEARKAGEKAAKEAARVAAAAIARVEHTAETALQLAELLSATLKEAAAGIDKKLSGKR
jgi:transcription initiation factor TFIIIB Brf1 subunit/transcription initiation factor TFIIB